MYEIRHIAFTHAFMVTSRSPLLYYSFVFINMINIRAMAKIRYTWNHDGQKWVPPSTLVPGRHLIGQRPPRPNSGRIWNGSTRFWLLIPPSATRFNHTYPIMAGLFDQYPTRARVIASSRDVAPGHFCGRRGRASELWHCCAVCTWRAYH